MGDFGIAKARFFGNSQGWDILMNSHSVFFTTGSGQVHLIFRKKNIFSRFFEHHEHHFPVVLLNILIILMIFAVVLVRFPLHLWPRLSGLITLSAGVGVYCCLCTDADRHALNWDDFGPKGAVMFADFQNYFRIFLWKIMFWTLIFKRSIRLDLIGMEIFNIFQLSQYSMDFVWIGKDVFICSGFLESAPGGTSIHVVFPHRHEAVLPVTRDLSRRNVPQKGTRDPQGRAMAKSLTYLTYG